MDQTTAVLLGSSIGAGGAVAAQIAASFFTARRETNRLNWEKDQAELRRADEKQRLHFDTKRNAFSHLIQQAVGRHELLVNAYIKSDPVERQAVQDLLRGDEDEWWSNFNSRIVEIELLAPPVADRARDLRAVIAEWEDEVQEHSFESGLQRMDAFRETMDTLQRAMRSEIGLTHVDDPTATT